METYLWGRPFLIKTDHYSLKFLLEQRLTTSPQQHWVSKLLGFDFQVEYRAGALNKAADALSRREEEIGVGELFALSEVCIDIFSSLQQEIDTSADLQDLRQQIIGGTEATKWSVRDGLIFYNKRAYLQPTSPLVETVLSGIHDSAHEGTQKTMERIRRDFYWKGWKKTVQDYVRNCVVCQRNKWETLQSAGLLQPFPIPTTI